VRAGDGAAVPDVDSVPLRLLLVDAVVWTARASGTGRAGPWALLAVLAVLWNCRPDGLFTAALMLAHAAADARDAERASGLTRRLRTTVDRVRGSLARG